MSAQDQAVVLAKMWLACVQQWGTSKCPPHADRQEQRIIAKCAVACGLGAEFNKAITGDAKRVPDERDIEAEVARKLSAMTPAERDWCQGGAT